MGRYGFTLCHIGAPILVGIYSIHAPIILCIWIRLHGTQSELYDNHNKITRNPADNKETEKAIHLYKYPRMISLGNVFGSLISTTRTGAGTEAEEKATASQLLSLPPEIIFFVGSTLQTPSATCLALFSRRLNHILVPGVWKTFTE